MLNLIMLILVFCFILVLIIFGFSVEFCLGFGVGGVGKELGFIMVSFVCLLNCLILFVIGMLERVERLGKVLLYKKYWFNKFVVFILLGKMLFGRS